MNCHRWKKKKKKFKSITEIGLYLWNHENNSKSDHLALISIEIHIENYFFLNENIKVLEPQSNTFILDSTSCMNLYKDTHIQSQLHACVKSIHSLIWNFFYLHFSYGGPQKQMTNDGILSVPVQVSRWQYIKFVIVSNTHKKYVALVTIFVLHFHYISNLYCVWGANSVIFH